MVDKGYYEAHPDAVCSDVTTLTATMQLCLRELQNTYPNIRVIEAWRSKARQAKLGAKGATKAKTSRHERGEAVDYCHKTRGYVVPETFWLDVQTKWKEICARYGYKNVKYLDWDKGHISLNDGKWI